MNFIKRAYHDFHVITFLFFVWAAVFSLERGTRLLVFSDSFLQDGKATGDLLLHVLTVVNALLILNRKAVGVVLWVLSPLIAYGLASLLVHQSVGLSAAFVVKRALYILIPLLLLCLKGNGRTGWRCLFAR